MSSAPSFAPDPVMHMVQLIQQQRGVRHKEGTAIGIPLAAAVLTHILLVRFAKAEKNSSYAQSTERSSALLAGRLVAMVRH